MFKYGTRLVLATFLLVAFLVGIAGALQRPTLSLFLTNEVKATPIWVGLFFAVIAIAGIVVSFLLGRYSDKRGDRRKLFLICCLMAVFNSLLFAYSRNYFFLISLGMMLSSIATAAMPQLFALAREYTDRTGSQIALFNSIMRAQISLAWVIGPPLAFMLALNYGFSLMYLCAAATFGVCALVAWLLLPPMPRSKPATGGPAVEVGALKNQQVRLLFVVTLLMWTCNGMYLIDMPLYITEKLGLHANLAGILMGVAAGLEIPFMILAGYLVKRTGKRRLMLFASCASIIFYIGIIAFPFQAALIALQLFNAIFVGIVAGIGMLYFQDLMPRRAGAATTMFSNGISTGMILAGLLQGGIVEYVGHHAVYWAATGLAVAALLVMYKVRDA